ncbi:T-cell-specific surface glycoprotein CD28-like [Lepisosteus oculatus]|uniref:T-cell-specific surface glycoprotein CD28-like n=1 Tax=Lepisosteus oculatus TaxID=7918 RepID=UPI0035F50BDE
MNHLTVRVSWLTVVFICVLIGLVVSKDRNVSPPRVLRAAVHGNVTVECKPETGNLTGDEIKFVLFQNGRKERCFGTKKQNDTLHDSSSPEACPVNFGLSQAYFTLSQLQTHDTGIYSCDIEVLYPPPYRKINGSTTVLIVDENECKEPITPCGSNFPLTLVLMIAGCVILLYSLVITVIMAICYIKQKNKKHNQNDYMNMKPRGLKKHQGVLHPTRNGRY